MPHAQISEATWSQIFTLMAAVILVDDEAEPSEIDAFIKEADRLSTLISPLAHITPEHIGAWLKHHHKAIRAVINGPTAEAEFISQVLALDSLYFRQDVLNAMMAISASNQNIQDQEFNIINLAAAYWGLSPVRKI